jgi:Acetoacetate decarboxylase (ADC)
MRFVTLTTDEISRLVGLPETVLPPAVAAALPETTPGPPWQVRMSALLWWHRARRPAAEGLPAGLEKRRGFGVTSAGFINYAETPVGPYSEVMAMPVSTRGGLAGRVHIPFIAVDSLASVHGGRAHWALPKVLANFRWYDPSMVSAEGDGWWLAARVLRTGPPVPLLGRAKCAQVRPDGRVGVAPLKTRGYGRLLIVDVEVDPDASYARWLTPGRHLGVAVRSATLTMGPPRWQPARG